MNDTKNSEEKQVAIVNQGIVMPQVNPDQAVAAWKVYQDLKSKIVDKDSDVQLIQGKEFLKKSYWRKIATFFNLTVEIVDEKNEKIGKTFVWHFTCKAIAPNGRTAIGTGSCDAYEKAVLQNGKYMAKGDVLKWGKTSNGKPYPLEFAWKEAVPNSIHNIRTTAETRAFNRAVSNLVGGGEVSAEEVNNTESYNEPIKAEQSAGVKQGQASQPVNSNSQACSSCGAPVGKPHGTKCEISIEKAIQDNS